GHGAAELLARAPELARGGTTAVLLTPYDLPASGPGAGARGSRMVAVSAARPEADAWFRFDPRVDFAAVMPPEQQPAPDDGPQPATRPAPAAAGAPAPDVRRRTGAAGPA